MSTLTVYGIGRSRTARTLWMCRELGLEFAHVPVDFVRGTKTPEFQKLNPNGRIPVIDDGGFVLYESLIINLYLAKKYGTQLYPNSTEDEARSWQWTMWVMTEVEKPLFFVLLQRLRFPPGTPEARYFDEYQPVDPDQERAAIFQLQRPLAVLNRHLAARRYILGDTFTVADLNVASVLAATRVCTLDLSREPHVVEWLERCLSRPAARQLL